MKKLILLLIIIICIVSMLMQCEDINNPKEILPKEILPKEIQWTTYTILDGLTGNYVGPIAIDKEGNKWFGTNEGVSKFDDNTWTNYTISDGLVSNYDYVNAISIDNEGNKWFSTDKRILKFDGNTWTNYTPSFNNPYLIFRSIAIDAQDNKWVGTNGKGVLKFNGTTWTTYTISDGLVNNAVGKIAIDKEGNKWFGTNEGVSKFDDNSWTNYTTSDGLVGSCIYAISIDSKGNMWFGTNEGVSKFDGRKWTNYRFSNYPISDGYGRVSNHIIGITIDAQDILWVLRRYEKSLRIPINYGDGGFPGAISGISWVWGEIIFLDDKKWTTVYNGYNELSFSNEDESQIDILIFNSIVIDKENNKWLGTNRGVIKLSN